MTDKDALQRNFEPCCLATTIGSLPHIDVTHGTRLMFESTPEILRSGNAAESENVGKICIRPVTCNVLRPGRDRLAEDKGCLPVPGGDFSLCKTPGGLSVRSVHPEKVSFPQDTGEFSQST